jgi:hypothetical protein
MPIIPALGREKQKDHKFQASLGYRLAWVTCRDPISKQTKRQTGLGAWLKWLRSKHRALNSTLSTTNKKD